jgi:hypothetical protein
MKTPFPMFLCACSSLVVHMLMLIFVRWDGEEAFYHDLLMSYGVVVLDDAIRVDEGHLR